MGYEVGQKVVIHPESCYYGEGSSGNPRETIGIVSDDYTSVGWFGVLWSNGYSNNYEDGDLKVLGDTGMSESEIKAWWEECKRGE